jgi:Fe-S-cluster-containing dehydrogenase component
MTLDDTPRPDVEPSCRSGCDCGHDQGVSRRLFLERATTIAIGTLSLTILPGWTAAEKDSSASDGKDDDASGPVYGFLVDIDKCIGSGKCVLACRIENDVPEGHHRTWVERYVHFKDGRLQIDLVPETGYSGADLPVIDEEQVSRAYFVPKMCNHCEDAPCNQVCPVHASFTSPEGMELVDSERCIGCGYCVQACPYGVRFINEETGTADKCTWCYHRVTEGGSPACVEACPVDARLFGRLDDPESAISKRIAETPTHVLKEHLGTHPKTRYIGLSREVI